MNKEILEKIKNDPDYIKLVTTRKKFAWGLTFVLLLIYYSFILTIAFDPKLLGTPISKDSIITIGIPIGVLIIIAAFILTGIYVNKANKVFDELTRKIKLKYEKGV
ncbi:DUF485 domain-containing protein [Caminibacter mediatlanticus TB-2]|uniref:DUF485 domain-containing protein n=1 Tax=Caminibacter mediatlanticus TB-2 TaxID=391592 RepID=A0AAI9AHU3_9BACT|nr:DUF485 domain-containing protein [Caminibacter mediatlanticus]EDM23774.1 hypothetical protein CMTB2_00864 [Caminibacter mediatlanticus TB-2]QCT94668.1 DUF485 domain-containing protein [Caminibacter mediatlanticus TB-2]